MASPQKPGSLVGRIVIAFISALTILALPVFANTPGPIEDAVNHSERLKVDRESDVARKPVDVLSFIGIKEGMTVFDVGSGGGYYTELVARIVEPDGRVVAHNVYAVADVFARDGIAERYSKIRIPGVTRVISEFKDIDLGVEQFDAVLMILAYHDVYYAVTNENFVWTRTSPSVFLKAIYDGLKPGGVVGLVDHADEPGAPIENVAERHRIDPAIVRRDFKAAGFVLEAEADFLANPGDDYSKSVFDPSVRRKTDRFVMRFRKPGQ
jgi:predicted methyltransferase